MREPMNISAKKATPAIRQTLKERLREIEQKTARQEGVNWEQLVISTLLEGDLLTSSPVCREYNTAIEVLGAKHPELVVKFPLSFRQAQDGTGREVQAYYFELLDLSTNANAEQWEELQVLNAISYSGGADRYPIDITSDETAAAVARLAARWPDLVVEE